MRLAASPKKRDSLREAAPVHSDVRELLFRAEECEFPELRRWDSVGCPGGGHWLPGSGRPKSGRTFERAGKSHDDVRSVRGDRNGWRPTGRTGRTGSDPNVIKTHNLVPPGCRDVHLDD